MSSIFAPPQTTMCCFGWPVTAVTGPLVGRRSQPDGTSPAAVLPVQSAVVPLLSDAGFALSIRVDERSLRSTVSIDSRP